VINQRRSHTFRAWLAGRAGLSSTGLAAQALAKEEASPCRVWRQGKDRPSIVAYASSLFPRVLVPARTKQAGMLMLLCRPDAAHRFMPASASGRFGELESKPTIILLTALTSYESYRTILRIMFPSFC